MVKRKICELPIYTYVLEIHCISFLYSLSTINAKFIKYLNHRILEEHIIAIPIINTD